MNDLIGLKYGWGHAPGDGSGKTDCFQLACEIHRRLGFADYAPSFQWVYDCYTEQSFSRRLIARWLLENGKRLRYPRHGAVGIMPGHAGSAMASIVDDQIMLLSPAGNVVRTQIPENVGHYFWMHQ